MRNKIGRTLCVVASMLLVMSLAACKDKNNEDILDNPNNEIVDTNKDKTDTGNKEPSISGDNTDTSDTGNESPDIPDINENAPYYTEDVELAIDEYIASEGELTKSGYKIEDLKHVDGDLYLTPDGKYILFYYNNYGDSENYLYTYKEELVGTLIKEVAPPDSNKTTTKTNSRIISGEEFTGTIDYKITHDNWDTIKSDLEANPSKYADSTVSVRGTFTEQKGSKVLLVDSDYIQILAATYPSYGIETEAIGTMVINSQGEICINVETLKIYY